MSVLLRIIFVALIFVLVGCAAVRITSESGHAEDVSVSEIIGEPLWIPAHSFDERSFPRNQFIGDLKQVTLFKSVAVYDATSCCKNRVRDEVIENSRHDSVPYGDNAASARYQLAHEAP